MNKNILICIEQLSAGGVETAVLNRVVAFKEKGFNVFIASRDGIYRKKAEQIGVKWIDYDYKMESKIDVNEIKKMENIIRNNDIGQVHIHHFPCLIYAGIVCCMLKIPYNVYVHTEVTDVYNWFMYHFKIQKELMKDLINNAYRIIAVTYRAALNNKEFFEVADEEKYIVEHNSISFSDYKNKTDVKEINRFLIVSRLAEGKYVSVKNGIDLFISYANAHKEKNVSLTIVGDGQMKEELQKHTIEKNIEKHEIVFARRNR